MLQRDREDGRFSGGLQDRHPEENDGTVLSLDEYGPGGRGN